MNIMIFCSNPVNGGTARIFYESVEELKKRIGQMDKIYPCVNKDNDVEIYKKILDLIELPIISAETLFPDLYGGGILKRLINSTVRSMKYSRIKKKNIQCICDFVRDNKIDSILIHNGGYVGDDLCNQALEAAYKCRDVAKNRMYIFHNDMKKGFISKVRFKGYDRKISRESTEIITVSEFTKNRIKTSSYIKKDIKVIYDGIDVKKRLSQTELDKTIHVNPKKHNVLMIGNFLENKGQRQFIECASILYGNDHDYRFVIIGNIYDRPYYENCMRLIQDESLNEIISIYQGINNASDYIDMFDVQAVPSIYDESFGLISVEAMANGVPVVAFACGGIPEVVIDGRNGFVVSVGDNHTMADRIDYLVTHDYERILMGEKCKEDYQAKFSTNSMINQYIALLGIDI